MLSFLQLLNMIYIFIFTIYFIGTVFCNYVLPKQLGRFQITVNFCGPRDKFIGHLQIQRYQARLHCHSHRMFGSLDCETIYIAFSCHPAKNFLPHLETHYDHNEHDVSLSDTIFSTFDNRMFSMIIFRYQPVFHISHFVLKLIYDQV